MQSIPKCCHVLLDACQQLSLLFTKVNKFQIQIVLNLDTEIKVFKIVLRF